MQDISRTTFRQHLIRDCRFSEKQLAVLARALILSNGQLLSARAKDPTLYTKLGNIPVDILIALPEGEEGEFASRSGGLSLNPVQHLYIPNYVKR